MLINTMDNQTKINEIVKSTCTDFNVRYQEFPTMLTAIKSHFNYLKSDLRFASAR